jgi:hypothetical protein
VRSWLERIRDYFTRPAYQRACEHFEPLVQTTRARCDLYETVFLQQQKIINRLKTEKERCKCCSLD